ncbi:putative MPP superfamily phosphohydrolase [Cryobacterium mesophilum]|uniref:metallophosphoesterase n=1 Tax=Terrimesophilobacter mesophilus TaxID=433647 RepID=UPI001836FA6D|nr:metallophosphoesterase [Terrimesophilobacter mesophilus]MBB5633539.1 putative MPP superfamily phosphohydrolase [Terrimesophilobacter mesophilus]
MTTAGGARIAGSVLATLGAAALGAFAWGALVERNRFTVRRDSVPVLDPAARPVTVLHLSDLHMAPWQTAKQEWIRSLTDYEPDLVVLTGDLLGHERGLEGVQRALEPFHGIPGVFVHGSNDYFAPAAKNPFRYLMAGSSGDKESARLDTRSLDDFLESLGWLNLDNTARAMSINGSRLEFLGVNDAHRNWDRLDKLPGALDEMRENVGWQDDRDGPEPVTIGLTHAPYQRVLNSFVNHSADVIFAGHTHGGQVQVPGFGALVTNCDLPREYANGLHVWHHAFNAAYLEVSAGIGTSIYAPVRFACPPEAVVVTLTGDDFGYS